MNVLVINCGSSSLKYQFIDTETDEVFAKGLCERIGIEGSQIVYQKEGCAKEKTLTPMNSHNDAIALVIQYLMNEETGVVKSLNEIDAIGHRIVHGGDYFDKSALIDDEVLAKIEDLCTLAPLHNPPALKCINVCRKLAPNTPMVAVFDTSFFQTLPASAYMYPLPYDLCMKHRIRKYGAHGTSHRYVAQRCAAMMEKPVEDLKIITCHIGSGCSISAVDHGIAVDTSMGFTPLDGLIMGTRSGSVDPTAIAYAMEMENIDVKDLSNFLNKQSGYLGLTEGRINDDCDMRAAAADGDEQANLCIHPYEKH